MIVKVALPSLKPTVIKSFKLESLLHQSDYYNSIKFPQIKYFQTKKNNLTEPLNEMIKKEKEKKKKKMIPQEYVNNPDYMEFVRELNNPALGQTYLEKKYGKLYDDFYVNYLIIRI